MPITSRRLQLGTRMPWFDVTDLNGDRWTTERTQGHSATLIAFLSQHSPYVQHIEGQLAQLARDFQKRGVLVLGIAPNDPFAYPSDSDEKLRQQAVDAEFEFPYALDTSQRSAKAFQASCTPEFFVYDDELRLVYHGQFDASRPDNSIFPDGHHVSHALTAVLAHDIVSADQPRSLGCSIKWRAGNEPNYVFSV